LISGVGSVQKMIKGIDKKDYVALKAVINKAKEGDDELAKFVQETNATRQAAHQNTLEDVVDEYEQMQWLGIKNGMIIYYSVVGYKMSRLLIDNGVRGFVEFCDIFLSLNNNSIKPRLKSFYYSVMYLPIYSEYKFDTYEFVNDFDLDSYEANTERCTDEMRQLYRNFIKQESEAEYFKKQQSRWNIIREYNLQRFVDEI